MPNNVASLRAAYGPHLGQNLSGEVVGGFEGRVCSVPKDMKDGIRGFSQFSPDVVETWRYTIEGYALDMDISSGAELIVIGGVIGENNGIIYLFDKSGRLLWKYTNPEPFSSVAISDDGNFIVAGSDDHQTYFFDRRGLLLWRYSADKKIRCVEVSEDGQMLVTGSDDNNVYFFDNSRRIKRFAWKYRFDNSTSAVAMSKKGNYILAGSDDHGIYALDSDGQLMWKHTAKGAITSVSVSKFADYLVAGSQDGNIYCFNIGGKETWTQPTGGSVLSVAVDLRGTTIVGYSQDGSLYCLDERGTLLWKLTTGDPEGRVSITDDGQVVMCLVGDGRNYVLTRDGGLLMDFQTRESTWGAIFSGDGENFVTVGARIINFFDTRPAIVSLIQSCREAIKRANRQGSDIQDAMELQKQAVQAYKGHDYSEVFESLLEVEESLEESKQHADEMRSVRNEASKTINLLQTRLEEAEELSIDTKYLKKEIDAAMEAFRDGDYENALEGARGAEPILQDIGKAVKMRQRAKYALDQAQREFSKAQMYDDVRLDEVEKYLGRAMKAFDTGNFQSCLEYSSLAYEFLLKAKSKSPKAIEKELKRAKELIASGDIKENANTIEGALLNSITHYMESSEFASLGSCYETLGNYWKVKESGDVGARVYRSSMEAAIYAYYDAGDLERCVLLAKEIENFRAAAKYLEVTKANDEAKALWEVVEAREAEDAAHLLERGEPARKEADVLTETHKPLEAATVLAKAHLYEEAAEVLRGESDLRSVLFLTRLLHQEGDYDRLIGVLNTTESSLRYELAHGNTGVMSAYGTILLGHEYLAVLLGMKKEAERVHEEIAHFASDYLSRVASKEATNEEVSDGVVVYHYLKEHNREDLLRLIKTRSGPLWELLETLEERLEKRDLRGFKQFLQVFWSEFVPKFYPVMSPLPQVQPPKHVVMGFQQVFPFNVMARIHEIYSIYLNRDYFVNLKNQSDQLLIDEKYDEAGPLYEEMLAMDKFAYISTKEVRIRLAGALLGMDRRADAEAALEPIPLTLEEGFTQLETIPGLETVVDRHRSFGLEGQNCPNCGTEVPKVAVRCYKCGTKLL
jgi:outer membrane protein assembly factor BamB/tetratricopeptide (TPR) repeat protein